jgi:hypothetical protein
MKKNEKNVMPPNEDVLSGKSKVGHFVPKGSKGTETGFFKNKKIFFLTV